MNSPVVIVVGLGEVGKPLLNLLSRTYECVGVDLEPVEVARPCSVLHLCIPFQLPDFVGTCAGYIRRFSPELSIVNSTVAPGTTRELARRTNRPVVYSPVRGKHSKMEKDMLLYRKFVGADDPAALERALQHFQEAGFKTGIFATPDTGELAKLVETTWLGLLVGWAQEVERIGAIYGATYADVSEFTEEISFLPQGIFPGFIGGHCVMPNIEIMRSQIKSEFLDAIVNSNEKKAGEIHVAAGGTR